MTSAKQVFISVKYRQDQVVERSISRYLQREGWESHHHEGAADLLDRVDTYPTLTDFPTTVFATHLLAETKHRPPPESSSELIRALVDSMDQYPVVLVVWTRAYSSSFWCQLELQTAQGLNKPLVVVHGDDCPLPPRFLLGLRAGTLHIIDIDEHYRTCQVAARLLEALPANAAPRGGDRRLLDDLEERFRCRFQARRSESAGRSPQRAYCEYLLNVLFLADWHGELRPALAELTGTHLPGYHPLRDQTQGWIRELRDAGMATIEPGFRGYLEDLAQGATKSPSPGIDDRYCIHLLGEVLDFVFLPPRLPQNLEKLYLHRLRPAVDSGRLSEVKDLLDDLIEDCLYTREFVEHLFHLLAQRRRSEGGDTAFLRGCAQLCEERGSRTA